jgi:DNA polymerase delta subunit 1
MAKISEILDETTIIVLSDTELNKEYFNRKIRFQKKDMMGLRVWPCDDVIDDTFTGASVLEAKNGFYTENIAVLDFASLYPTVQISRNLCYSTLIMDTKYLDIPDVQYETISWDDEIEYKLKHTCEGVGKSGKSKGQICGKQAYFEVENCKDGLNNYYCRIHDPLKKERLPDEKCQKKQVNYSYTIVQPHKDSTGNIINKGVVPSLLEELYSERKRVKKEMAKAQVDGNKLLADILDSTQLAIKVSLNSVYGFLGRNQGNLICKPLGQLTTAVGRMLIEQSKDYAEGEFSKFINKTQLIKQKIKPIVLNLNKKDKENLLNHFKIK